jgi:ACS family glucarate transporter-like MFS transporter
MQPPAKTAELSMPTRQRHVVLGLLGAMAFVLYLDRNSLGQAAESMRTDLGLSQTDMSYVHMAFTLAYGLFEIPTGHWGDRYGARKILTRIVGWWSAFTMLTGAAFNLPSLLVIRFLFGAGEAGAFPNAARVIRSWFPLSERGRAQGTLQAASLVAAAMTPWITSQILLVVGWRWTFVGFGVLGVAWVSAFLKWFHNSPREHPDVNAAERDLIEAGGNTSAPHHEPIPWREVLRHPTIWLLSLATTFTSFNSYFYFSWYPTYLKKAREVSESDAGLMATIALTGAALGTMLGGFLVDRVTRRSTNLWRTRRWVCTISHCLAAMFLLLSVQQDSPWLSALFANFSLFCMFAQQPTWWACAMDVSGRHLGALFGLMNGMGVFGAMASQFLVGRFVDHREALGFVGRERWDPAFYVYAAVLGLAALTWQFIRVARPVGASEVRS